MSNPAAAILDDELDAEVGRDFKGLDAREAQAALAEELSEDSETENVSEQSQEIEEPADSQEETLAEAVSEAGVAENGVSADSDDEIETAEVEVDTDTDTGESEAGEVASAEPTEAQAASEEVVAEKAEPIVWTEEDLVAHGRMLEALLFAAAEPLDRKTLVDRLPDGADIPTLIERVVTDYAERGINLKEIDGKWRFVTAADVAHILDKERVTPRKLSRAALETLAIISYHQPCTRADIEDVRGVQVAKGSLDQLLEIGWVRLRGKRRDVPGRPTLYGTTDDFLQQFGLATIEDLPGLADLKAAGLLDARLPPGFSVPSPMGGDDDEESPEEAEGAEFAQDFLAEEGENEEVSEE